MERLTFWENGRPCYKDMRRDPLSGENAEVVVCGGPIATKLATYEDAEEQGVLVRLPCKPGNDVFCIIGGGIFIGYVECWGIYENNQFVGVRVDGFGRSCTWGKTVFATREEAEKALEGMK